MLAHALDEVLPRYDVNEVHERRVEAPPAAVWKSLHEVTGDEIRLLRPLMILRTLPSRLLRQGDMQLRSSGPVLGEFQRHGFLTLAERHGEQLVMGAVGRFWEVWGDRPVAAVADVSAFDAFDQPGYAKVATSFEVRPLGAGSHLRTETRVAGTDAAGSRYFRAYWLVIRPGSGLIRLSWLAAIRRRALTMHPATPS